MSLILICNRAGFLLDSGIQGDLVCIWRDRRSSKYTHGKTQQALIIIFSRTEPSKNLHDYMFLISDQKDIFENKNLSTREVSFMRERTHTLVSCAWPAALLSDAMISRRWKY